jgi:hypothetical protein
MYLCVCKNKYSDLCSVAVNGKGQLGKFLDIIIIKYSFTKLYKPKILLVSVCLLSLSRDLYNQISFWHFGFPSEQHELHMHVHTCKLYPTYNQSKCLCMHDNSEVKVTLIKTDPSPYV